MNGVSRGRAAIAAGRLERHSIRRILVVSDPVGRAKTRRRPWLWRLRDPSKQTVDRLRSLV